jgi:HD superfamily phosphohydrolase
MSKTRRIWDPIHNMIVFEDDLDKAVWRLLNTPEVQRLRRIKQLGVSEFVFPSATHTRFAHSVGVFHNARQLVRLFDREIKRGNIQGAYDEGRARISVLAALLHDVGHGPFSHAFEEARKAIAGARAPGKIAIRKHEYFSAEIIRSEKSEIGSILSGVGVKAEDVAGLIQKDVPADMYHAVVSSSFDADRLDYLQRDRYMTGVGTGAIDLPWLLDNVRVAEIDFAAPGDDGIPIYNHSFCLFHKAREAGEDFLLARYRLYTNVYFHKTTRGFEQLVSAFFRIVAKSADDGRPLEGLNDDDRLYRFFGKNGESIENYLALDDAVVWNSIHRVASSGAGLAQLVARMLLDRRRLLCLDVQNCFPLDAELQRRLKHQLEHQFKADINSTIFRDTAKLSIYGQIGGDDSRAQKRLMIQLPTGKLKEITGFDDSAIAQSNTERSFERYYFLHESDYKVAQDIVGKIVSRP